MSLKNILSWILLTTIVLLPSASLAGSIAPQPECSTHSDCNDGNACTSDTCSICTGCSPKRWCTRLPINFPSSSPCLTVSCNPATGVSYVPTTVPPPDQCHLAGACSVSGSQAVFTYPNAPDGTSCTTGAGYLGSCVDGGCARLSPITMDALLDTRPWTGPTPASAASAVSTFNGLLANVPGYWSGPLTTLSGWSNHTSNPGGATQNIAYHLALVINVKASQVGTWAFRVGPDFSNGGVILADGAAIASRWSSMYWNNTFANPAQTLSGTVSLTQGLHTIDIYGFSSGPDRAGAVQFIAPGGPTTWGALTSTTVNLALGKPATQSSTLAHPCSPFASKAVDGTTNGIFHPVCSTTSTNYEAQPWWQVDLGAPYTIDHIELWNRTDCCGARLSNFDVKLSTTGLWTGAGVTSFYEPGTAPAHMPITWSGAIGPIGQFVRVQLRGSEILSLSEVQVFGEMTCTDGIQNQGEAGVDCGGPCSVPCILDGSTAGRAGASCQSIHAQFPAVGSGVRWINPDGGGPVQPFQVYCDMATLGGGWTLVASNWITGSGPPQPSPLGQTKMSTTTGLSFTQARFQCQSTATTVDRVRTFAGALGNLDAMNSGAGEIYRAGDNVAKPTSTANYQNYTEWHGFGGLYQRYILRPGEVHCARDFSVIGGAVNNPALGIWGQVWVR